MIHGIASIEAYSGAPTSSAPLVAQWLSLTEGWAGMCLRPSTGRILVYLESHLDEHGYRQLVQGAYDSRLREIRDCLAWAPDAIVSWDHEFDGTAKLDWRTWAPMDPDLYIAGFRKAASILGPLYWRGTQVWQRWAPYYPGDDAVSFVGFSWYDKGDLKPLPKAWAPRIAECRRLAPGTPIIVGEMASAVGSPKRLANMRTIEDVEGVYASVWFDVDMSTHKPPGPNWRQTPAMRAEWLP